MKPPPLPPRVLRTPAPQQGVQITHTQTQPAPPPVMPPMRAPLPSDDGVMSTRAKISLAEVAMHLRDEQLAARVVHYKADLETNRELDAITAQVVAELHALQKAARGRESVLPPPDRAQLEIELIQSLKEMLQRLFRADKLTSVLQRKMAEVNKRFAHLFFESELHAKMRGSEAEKTMRFGEQAVFHAFARTEPMIVSELGTFDYEKAEVYTRARERLDLLMKDLRNQYLACTTPELNQLVKILNGVLVQFFTQELPPAVGEFAWEVVKEGRLADAKVRAGYKISAEAFPAFRSAFERSFLHRLVGFAEEELLQRVRAREDKFRVDTIRFVADPQIFTDICELVCDAVYDFLYNDGFLDLPSDWRDHLAKTSA